MLINPIKLYLDMKIALFPGSFDPITIAHVDILKRALPLFDKIVVGIGLNSSKQSFLSAEKREEIVNSIFVNDSNVQVQTYQGLTIDFCKKIGANYMVRGIRSASDFEYERAIAQINKSMMPEVETIILLSKPEYSAISSTIVRDILRNNGDVSQFVPKEALRFF
ncbi:pantetheine-phosphate adenylyltransferase [Pedobacter sp.]